MSYEEAAATCAPVACPPAQPMNRHQFLKKVGQFASDFQGSGMGYADIENGEFSITTAVVFDAKFGLASHYQDVSIDDKNMTQVYHRG